MCEEYQNENPRNKTKMAYEELRKAYDAHMEWILSLSNNQIITDEDKNISGQRMILENENLTDCDFFVGKCLERAIFKNCILDRANFMHSNLESAYIQTCSMNKTTFDKANLKYAAITDCAGTYTAFRYANLEESEIENLRICEGDFRHSHLTEAIINEGKLEKCLFTRMLARYSEWNEMQFVNCTLDYVSMTDSKMYRCKMSQCDNAGIVLARTILTDCHANMCNFRQANLLETILENCDFSDNVLNMADFTGTQILNTCLDNCGLPLSSNIYGMIPDDRLVRHLLYCITKFQRDNMSEKMTRLIEQLENMRITGSLCDCSNEIEMN